MLSLRHETCHASQTVLLTRSLSDFVAPSFLNPFGCSHFHGPQKFDSFISDSIQYTEEGGREIREKQEVHLNLDP